MNSNEPNNAIHVKFVLKDILYVSLWIEIFFNVLANYATNVNDETK
jgi:hypothetical protein